MKKMLQTDCMEQWLILWAVNVLFIWKYMSRTSYSPLIGIVFFSCLFFILSIVYPRLKNYASSLLICSLIATIALIVLLLYKIEPLSVNVDRWSATTYFLDGLFSGIYPYGIHTHVCETNFPSPFPLWHYVNIPFWLMGDVGIGLIVFLLLFVGSVNWFTKSHTQTLLVLLLLMISPAYWWEVTVRSDGLSNAILVFCIILLMEKNNWSFDKHWIITAIICGMLASTRLSAIIPVAIYLARSFFLNSITRQIKIILLIALVVFFFFMPYIFWDTENWVFFSRNPFMSQSSTGNGWILLLMAVIAIILALRYRNFQQYTRYTSCFLFLFFCISLLYNHLVYHSDIPFFEDADFDVSYFTLLFPYCLLTITYPKSNSR